MAEDGSESDADASGTTDEDYRWKWLATVFTALYGLGFPFAALVYPFVSASYPPGTLMGALILGWLACVVYIVGPENIKVAKSLRG